MRSIYRAKGIYIITFCALLLLSYNNCSGQKFTFSPSKPFNPVDIEDIDCKKVIELSPSSGSTLRIPARDQGDVCYSVKLVSSVAYNPSASNPQVEIDVLASEHDARLSDGSKDKTKNANPYLLGKKVVNLILEGPRAIMLSGSADGKGKINVDNFILVGVMPTSEIYNPFYYKAYGTADCRIYNVPGNPIGVTSPYNNSDGIYYLSFNNMAVELIASAIGGTAPVDPQRVDGNMETNKNYSIDLRALDCGGIAVTSDIYLSFE